MGATKESDLIIYDDIMMTGVIEELATQTDLFTAGGKGAIVLKSIASKGDFAKETFFKALTGLVSRRDPNSVAGVADIALDNAENVSVKLNRKIGPVATTLDAMIKAGATPEEASLIVGQNIGRAIAFEYADSAITSLAACLSSIAALKYDFSGDATGTMTHTVLANGLSKFGDASSNIGAWVMHSKVYYDLVKQGIADKVTEVAGAIIQTGQVATLNRPVIVVDSPSLVIAGAPNKYVTLGLTTGAATVNESEGRRLVSQIVTGLENLVVRIQGEHAYNLSCKGFTYNVAAGANPAAATLGDAASWAQTATNIKSTAGVYILSK